jgi:Tfp pilus assembly protein FimT
MAARTRRSGYTLFEVVLVCFVLLAIAGLALPSLKGMYGYYKLNGAVDSVRAAWAQARARAIDEGRPYRFSVEPNGSHYRVAPDRSDFWSGGGAKPAGDQHDKPLVLEEALPAGVRFSIGEAPGAAPPPAADDVKDEKTKASGKWSTAVVFLPDGTAKDNVKITFQVRGTRATTLQLRGMTGNVSVQTASN